MTRALIALVAGCALVLSGCHQVPKGDEPVTTGKRAPGPSSPAGGGGARTDPLNGQLPQWQVVPFAEPRTQTPREPAYQTAVAAFDDSLVVFNVPHRWDPPSRGRASSRDELVTVEVVKTEVDPAEVSLADYAIRLAEGREIRQLTNARANAYVIVRDVALSEGDPSAGVWRFHTALFQLDRAIFKLEVRYESRLEWRFEDLANAIISSVQMRSRGAGHLPASVRRSRSCAGWLSEHDQRCPLVP